ncbi:MAG TPA: hypothetical protein DCL77_07830 [Prolixibacteraceae bacterium]|jgi:hypothetical protein|nr:hypothetical protein [Prolixibacteraceae bacterium]
MKRITVLAALIVFFLNSWGQTRMQLSFTAGPSVNWMSTDNRYVGSQKAIMGYDFGIIGDVFFSENEHYSLLTGLQVVNTGGTLAFRPSPTFSFEGESFSEPVSIKYNLRYLEVPFSIKLKTDEFHRAYYWGIFGLSALVNIGANGTTSDGTFKRNNIRDEINMFNLGMNVGVGFDFDLGANNSLSAGLIFQNGLTDVTTDNYFTDKTIVNSLKLRLALIF